MTTLTLMSEWQDWPLRVTEGEGLPDSYALDEIGEVVPLSETLIRDIAAWDSTFQATYVESDPVRSGFADPADRDRFIVEGRRLAQRIKQEAGNAVVVEYAGDGTISPETIHY